MNFLKKAAPIIGLVLIFGNLLGFVYLNSRPMPWTNKERLWHGFFWSMNDRQDFTLSTGLHAGDFPKIFDTYYVDGTFRTRQLSYFLEMVSFKFWQLFSAVCFRDYTLILLHVLNAFLLALIFYRLTSSLPAAALGGILFLNSGVALATLMYPFRNAKLLCVTFFLTAWLLVQNKKAFSAISLKRVLGFCACVLAMLFTDEMGIFFAAALIGIVCVKDGFSGRCARRLALYAVGTLTVYFGLAFGAYHYAETVTHDFGAGEHIRIFSKLAFYYGKNFGTSMRDIFWAFIGYFLKRSTGFWQWDVAGVLALASGAGICFACWKGKSEKLILRLADVFLGIFILKNLFLPHNAGVHNVFMPKTTVFPSLLFFSYYYVYFDGFLLAVILGLFLAKHAEGTKRFMALMLLLTLISFSHVLHLRNGPEDALAFMNFKSSYRQMMAQDIQSVGRFVNAENKQPVYLSFPTVNSPVLKGRRHDVRQLNLYSRVIPIRYLRPIEQGKLSVSFKNIYGVDEELVRCKTFYDPYTKEEFDLEKVRKRYSPEILKPVAVGKEGGMRSIPMSAPSTRTLVFFIKGLSVFQISLGDKVFSGEQTYGYSYQKFSYALPAGTYPVGVKVVPKTPEGVFLAGPVIID